MTRITRLTVTPKGEPIFSANATHIEIDDDSAGEFIVIRQFHESADATGGHQIRIDATEWPEIQAAVDQIVKVMQ